MVRLIVDAEHTKGGLKNLGPSELHGKKAKHENEAQVTTGIDGRYCHKHAGLVDCSTLLFLFLLFTRGTLGGLAIPRTFWPPTVFNQPLTIGDKPVVSCFFMAQCRGVLCLMVMRRTVRVADLSYHSLNYCS